jgi:Tol biopolymer transport system component
MLGRDLSLLHRELERETDDRFAATQTAPQWYPSGSEPYKTQTTASGSAIFTRLKSQAISTAEFLFSEIRSHKRAALFTGVTGVLALLVVIPFLPGMLQSSTNSAGNVQQVEERVPAAPMKPQKAITNAGTSVCSAISPDGKLVAHAEEQDGKQRLIVTNLESFDTSVVVPPEEVQYIGVTFSPDNSYLYFTRTEKSSSGILYRLALSGTPPVKLKEGVDSPISFSPEGDRFAFVRLDTDTNEYSVLVSDIAATEERTLATRKASNRFSLSGLAWSPDGSFVVCPAGRWNKGFHLDLIAIDLNTGQEKQIGDRSWSSVSQIAWQQDMSGLIVSARERTMAPHQVWRVTYPAGDVQRLTSDLNEYFGVSVTGEKIVTLKTDWIWRMWRLTRDGSSAPAAITSGGGEVSGIAWADKGTIVYSAMAQDRLNLSRIDADGSNLMQLTLDSGDNYTPAASPDGKFIVFTSNRDGGFNIYRLNIQTGNDIKQLTHTDGNAYPSVSVDNAWVAYDHVDELGRSVWAVRLEGGEPVKLSDGYRMPVFSPDKKLFVARSPLNSGPRDVAVFSAKGGPPLKRLNIPVMEWQRLYWLDNHTLSFIKNVRDTSNIWSYDINTDKMKQLTKFDSEHIFAYAWSPDYQQLVCQRGARLRNVTMIGSEQ